MAVLRFLSALFFLFAIVALAADATPMLSGDVSLHLASAQQRWSEIAPAVLNATQQSLANKGLTWFWTAVIWPLLAVPAVVLFGAVALVLGYAGRRRRRVKVFVN
jgi:hypothetical protein